MKRRNFSLHLSLLIAAAIGISFVATFNRVSSQSRDVNTATLVLRVDQPGPTINKNIYGHFAEHLGRLIYEGLWVGENSTIPNTHGLPNDVVNALKELHVPV